jgi:hypothetical protein
MIPSDTEEEAEEKVGYQLYFIKRSTYFIFL